MRLITSVKYKNLSFDEIRKYLIQDVTEDWWVVHRNDFVQIYTPAQKCFFSVCGCEFLYATVKDPTRGVCHHIVELGD